MKKLLSLVLAATMTLAIAAPAMAAKLPEAVTNFDYTNLTYVSYDKKLAQNLTKQADVIKITSNAHSDAAADLGITFNWNVKQKNDCVLTVATEDGTLGTFHSFDLLIQSSGTYQMVTVDAPGTYEVTKDAKNINMVYICNVEKHEFAAFTLSSALYDLDENEIDATPLTAIYEGTFEQEDTYLVEIGSGNVEISEVGAEVEGDDVSVELIGTTVNGDDAVELGKVSVSPEANVVYNTVFAHKLVVVEEVVEEDELDEEIIDLRGYGKITSHAHYEDWAELGIWCLVGDNKSGGYSYVTFAADFFEQHESVSILVKVKSSYYNLTITAEGEVYTDLPCGVSYNNGLYEFQLDQGAQASIAQLN